MGTNPKALLDQWKRREIPISRGVNPTLFEDKIQKQREMVDKMLNGSASQQNIIERPSSTVRGTSTYRGKIFILPAMVLTHI